MILNPRVFLGDAAKVREQGVEKVRISFDGEPRPKGPPTKEGGPPQVKGKSAAPEGKRAPATAKSPAPNKKKGPVAAE